MPSLFGVLLSWFPMLLLIAVWIFFMRQMQGGKGGAMGFGKSKAKMMNELKGKVTFNEVAGVEEAKEEVEEIVEFLKDPKKFSRLGGKIPKGALLIGPPGTGKTLLAKAIAGEANVPFFSISGSDSVEMFVGVGASRVRDMFEQGKKHSPCIIFIDEIDASISSINIIQGECFFPCSNISLTLEAPTPTNISTESDPDIEKKGTFASPAIALASNVLPVPGGPISKAPLGILPPKRLNFFGSFRNSTISSTSSLASSTPATSLNVTLPFSSFIIFAFDFPKPIAPPFPPCICLMKKIHTAISNNIGNHERRTPNNEGIFYSRGAAEILTPFSDNFSIRFGSLGA